MATTTGTALVSTAPTVVQTPQFDASRKQMLSDIAAKRKLQAQASKELTNKALGKLKDLDDGYSVRDKEYFNKSKTEITDYYTKMMQDGNVSTTELAELDAYINDYNTAASQSAEMNKRVESLLSKIAEKGDESLYTPESIQSINDWLDSPTFADKVENFDKLQLEKHKEYVDADYWMVKNEKDGIYLIDDTSNPGNKIVDENALINGAKIDALTILESRNSDNFDYLSARDGRYTLLNNITSDDGTVEVAKTLKNAQEYLNQAEFEKPISFIEDGTFLAPTGQTQKTIKQDDDLRKQIIEAGDQAFLELMDSKIDKGEIDKYTLRDYEEYKLMNNELEKLYRRHNMPVTKQPRVKQKDPSLGDVTTGGSSVIAMSVKVGQTDDGAAIFHPQNYNSKSTQIVEIKDKTGKDISGVNTEFSNGKLIKNRSSRSVSAAGDIRVLRGIKTATKDFTYEVEEGGKKYTIKIVTGQPIPDEVKVEENQYTTSDWVEIAIPREYNKSKVDNTLVPLSEVATSLKSITGKSF